MRQPDRINPFTRFQVVFEVLGAHEPLVLHSTLDADLATLAFYDERERLRHDHAAGDLLLLYHGVEERTLLREALGPVARGGCTGREGARIATALTPMLPR